MKKILFVDDEVQILKSLARIFMDSEYEIITVESGLEALKVLETEDVNMVISDMQMPNMDGYALLSKVKELYPHIIRVILSGYSDEKKIFKALQKNVAKLYMFKPWDNDKLMLLINQMFETEEMLNGSELLLLINNIENLPTIKTHYQKILDLIDEDQDMSVITSHIEQDVAIASKILQVANSAFYGTKTGSIKQAVSYIGLENTRKLIMSTSLIDLLSEKNSVGKTIEKVWNISYLSNRLTAFIYEQFLKKKIPDTYSTAALLQNIGTIFLIWYFKNDYLTMNYNLQNENNNFLEYERELFKVSHCEAGAYLLKWWEFPYPIIEAALYHHDPLNPNIVHKELIWCVHIANQYSFKLRGDENVTFHFEETVFDLLHISKDEFESSLVNFTI